MGSNDVGDDNGVRFSVQADVQSEKVGHAQVPVRGIAVAGERGHLEEPQIRHLGDNDPARVVRILRSLRPLGKTRCCFVTFRAVRLAALIRCTPFLGESRRRSFPEHRRQNIGHVHRRLVGNRSANFGTDFRLQRRE